MRQPRYRSLILIAALLTGCATHYMAERAPLADDRAGAVAANVWYVPGRALVCAMSAVLAGAALTITLGHVYEGASQVMHGGCAGPWTVDAQEIRDGASDR